MIEAIERLLPYIGIIPIGWAILNWFKFYYSNKTEKTEQILLSLSNRELLNKTQTIIFKNLDFLKSQNIHFDLEGNIKFKKNKTIRLLTDLIAIIVGVLWLSIFPTLLDSTIDIRSIIALFVMFIPIFIIFRWSNSHILFDLNNMIISNKGEAGHTYGHYTGTVMVNKNCFRVNNDGITFGDLDGFKQINVNWPLDSFEQVLWSKFFEDLFST